MPNLHDLAFMARMLGFHTCSDCDSIRDAATYVFRHMRNPVANRRARLRVVALRTELPIPFDEDELPGVLPPSVGDDQPSFAIASCSFLVHHGEMPAKKHKGTYKIVRMFRGDHPRKTVRRGLTLEEAQKHCREPSTSSSTCTDAKGLALTRKFGAWFDGYEQE